MSECRYARRLSSYYDGEVSGAERASLEAHLRQCPACTAELGRLRNLSQLLATVGRPELPAQSLARLHRASGTRPVAELGHMAKTFLAVAASILLICGVWLWRSSAAGESAEPIPVWETVAAAQQGILAAGSEAQLAQWIVRDLERKDGHD